MPIADPVATPFYYSFDVGRVHFLAFDTDQPYALGSAQHAFIVADLTNVDRAVTPIVYAFSHFPMLCSNYFWCNIEGPSKTNRSKAAEFREAYVRFPARPPPRRARPPAPAKPTPGDAPPPPHPTGAHLQ